MLAMFVNSKCELARIALRYDTTKLLDPECVQYLPLYERNMAHLRNRPIKLLEIGVKDGESLRMWKDYLHKDSEVYGMEINPTPLLGFSQDGINLLFGDQTNIDFLADVRKSGPFDIIIDDGGHTMFQMRTSFEYLFRYAMEPGGLYIIEDLGTAYWHRWSGGIEKKGTMMEYLKERVDGINHRFWKGGRKDYIPIPEYSTVDADVFDETIESILFGKGIAFITKGDNKFVG